MWPSPGRPPDRNQDDTAPREPDTAGTGSGSVFWAQGGVVGIGIALGIVFGLLIDNLGLGVALGVAIGASLVLIGHARSRQG